MAGAFDNKKTGVRILFGIFIGLIAVSMLMYLVPQAPSTGEASTDAVAKIGDQTVTQAEVRQQLTEIEQRNNGPIPKMMEGFYAQQILNQLLYQKEIEYEAKRMNISVSDQEVADRIKQILPMAYKDATFVGKDQYAELVQRYTQHNVADFEELVRKSMLEEKFSKLVTDGISVGPAELQEEFRYRNEKVKLEYALIKPEELEAKITPDEAEIKAAFERNKAKYQVPEKRVVRYAVVDVNQIRLNTQISDDDLKMAYMQSLQQYQVPNRVHLDAILFVTTGKTDAELTEIRKRADDVLKQIRKGAKFEDLAKKFSEDVNTREKGGDLGWIVQGQMLPELERTAFALNPGAISDVIQTKIGVYILKAVEKETAHTKALDEVKESIRAPLLLQRADKVASDKADQLSAAIRQSNKTSLDDLAQKFHLTIAETRPVAAAEPVLELGNSPEVKDQIFRLKQGELSLPLHTDRGYVVISVKQILAAHQGSLEEARDRVIADLKQEKATEQAQAKANELEKRLKAGEKLPTAAKALGLEGKTGEAIARGGSIAGVGSGKQLAAAFQMKVGDVAAPLNLGAGWVVYRVVEKTEPNPADFEAQKKDITDHTLQTKRSLAYEAFRTALEDRLKKEGKLQLMPDKMKSFGTTI
jgi:peptidyl-prolyl cis-trans isomerase D